VDGIVPGRCGRLPGLPGRRRTSSGRRTSRPGSDTETWGAQRDDWKVRIRAVEIRGPDALSPIAAPPGSGPTALPIPIRSLLPAINPPSEVSKVFQEVGGDGHPVPLGILSFHA
jgi:hypothetical protein